MVLKAIKAIKAPSGPEGPLALINLWIFRI